MQWRIALVLGFVSICATDGHAGGNLASFPPVELRIDIKNGPDGKPILEPSELKMTTGDYYRLTLSSDGKGRDSRGDPLARRVELSEFLANVHLRILSIDGIEVHLQGMSFRAIELDEKGEASFTFVPIRPGNYSVYVGPNPFDLGRPAGEQGVQRDPRVAFATLRVE